MENWVQAIYDVTGIPLKDEDLTLVQRDGQWWLELHRYPVLPVGVNPDPYKVITQETRKALARGMEQRLAENVPKVQHLIEQLGADRAQQIAILVVSTDERGSTPYPSADFERGWPHFLLRLSAGGFDVEVDLNPYVPDEPFEFDEVQRQASVILQVAGLS